MIKIKQLFQERLAGIKEISAPHQDVGTDDIILGNITDSEIKKMFCLWASFQEEMAVVREQITTLVISFEGEKSLNIFFESELRILSKKVDVLMLMLDMASMELRLSLAEKFQEIDFANLQICKDWVIVEVDGKKDCGCVPCRLQRKLEITDDTHESVQVLVSKIAREHSINN